MDKNAIKKYAVWARRELISRVSQRAALYEITDKGYGDASADSVLGRVMSAEEKRQRQALIAQIREKGYEQVMEEIAYTWFNRFIALRFMEVNGYLPSRVRVFTDDENKFKPQVLTEAINMELDGLDMEKVYALKNANDDDALFKYMIIVQCNALSSILPGMFQHISDFTELLFPDNLLREGSVIEQMVTMIPEEDWTDQVQIIGWLYQYYNTEPKDKVFADLKKNIKISKENIPAATQLFTPDWIVRYMVENSLGRLWLEGHPNDELKASWKYYLDEAEQEPEVQAQLAEIRKEYAALTPEDILAIDPCQGSGHILAYMFDVLVQIYEAYGYTAREAAASIVKHNIWGLDIDDRAAQLAYFSVMMKARQYDRRFFSRGIQPHVYAIQESNGLDRHCIEFFADGRNNLKLAIDTLVGELHDAKEYGSILTMAQIDFDALYARLREINEELSPSVYSISTVESLMPLVNVAEVLSNKYHVVVTNPPYMGNKSMSVALSEYVKSHYSDSKSDMFAVFIERCSQFTRQNGYFSMITQPSLLTLLSFEKLRRDLITNHTISSLIHFGRGIFGIDFGSTAFSIRKELIDGYKAEFYRPHERTFQYVDPDDIKELFLRAVADHDYHFDFSQYNSGEEDDDDENEPKLTRIHYSAQPNRFLGIPTTPFCYWISDVVYTAFDNIKPLSYYAEPKQGMATADNNRFLRLWQEVDCSRIGFNKRSAEEAICSGKKWFPYNKGGAYRKWYGNNEYLVNWESDGRDIRAFSGSVIRNPGYYFRSGLTWGALSAGAVSFRYSGEGFLFDSKGPVCFPKKNTSEMYLLALVNSAVSRSFLKILAPTMDFNQGPIGRIPYLIVREHEVEELAEKAVAVAKADWDSYEISWDFQQHPLVGFGAKTIKEAFDNWEIVTRERFEMLRKIEESMNSIFIDAYGLEDELTPYVEDKDISVRKADLDTDIKNLISYVIGCMFGRYSLDTPGLISAGDVIDLRQYGVFTPDQDGIIPICDDEYFEDDIVGRFIKFIETAYGSATLEENLRFIADALGGKGSSREVIRNYFINDFYADHLKVYQKRPIYWLFDSGKKNGFKCLIYMHRYQPDTIARIRTDYVHEQQSRYRTAIADLEGRIANAGTGERVKLSKQLTKLQEQAEELRVYEEKIHHLADQMIRIDLDDGVKHNYAIFQDVLAKIK